MGGARDVSPRGARRGPSRLRERPDSRELVGVAVSKLIRHRVFGVGPLDIVLVSGLTSNIDSGFRVCTGRCGLDGVDWPHLTVRSGRAVARDKSDERVDGTRRHARRSGVARSGGEGVQPAGTNWISSSSLGAYCPTMSRIQSITGSVSVRKTKPGPPQVWRLKPKPQEVTPTIRFELNSP